MAGAIIGPHLPASPVSWADALMGVARATGCSGGIEVEAHVKPGKMAGNWGFEECGHAHGLYCYPHGWGDAREAYRGFWWTLAPFYCRKGGVSGEDQGYTNTIKRAASAISLLSLPLNTPPALT